MVIDNKKENTKIHALIKEILASTKPKSITSSTQKLIKLIQPLQLNIELDTTPLFLKVNELPDKLLFIELGYTFYTKQPSLIKPELLSTLLDWAINYPFEDIKVKLQTLKALSQNFKGTTLQLSQSLIEFLYFEFLIKDETFSQEALKNILTLIINSSLTNEIIELLVDTSIIRAFGFRNDKTKISDLLPCVLHLIEFYMTHLAFHKAVVIKNIIALLAYYTFLLNSSKGSPNAIDPWRFMGICYQNDGKIFRILLNNVVYYPEIAYSFTGVEAFEAIDDDCKTIDSLLKEKRERRGQRYKLFIQSQQDSINVLKKERKTICKGAILFIGWSLWGYKRINTLVISNCVVLHQFLKAVKETQGLSFEVIRCLQRLVKKYGRELIDEWSYIYDIIDYILTKEPEWNSDPEKDDIIKDIVHNINVLVIDHHYYGDVLKAKQFIKKMKPSSSVMDIIIKTHLLLLSKEDFYSNYQGIIIENFINSKSIQIKTFIMEMIRHIYCFSSHEKLNKAKIIEDNLVKYYNEIINSFENDETNLSFFSHLLTSIALSTTELPFVEKLFKSILSHQPEADKKERKKNYEKFQYTTLKTIYDNINSLYQIDKAKRFNKFFFKRSSIASEKIMRFDMWLMTKLLVNESSELFLSNTNKLQLLTLNFRYSPSLTEKKTSDKNLNKLGLRDPYQPYVVLKHNKLFAFLITQLKKDETNSSLCEDILEFFLRALRKIFFFHNVSLVDVIKEIVDKEDISKYSSRKKMVVLLEEILLNVSYHLPYISLEPAYTSELNANTAVLNIKADNLKGKSLLCLLNSFESFSAMFYEILRSFKTIIQFEKYQLSSIKNKFVLDVNTIEQHTLPQKSLNETQLTFYVVLGYLLKTMTSLHFNFTSIIPHSVYANENEGDNDRVNFNSPEARYVIKGNPGLEIKQFGSKEFTELIKRFLNDLMANISFSEHIQNYSIAVLHCLIGMKELLWQFGDIIMVKVIYLALLLGYPEDQAEIEASFEALFGFKEQKKKKQDDMLLVHDKTYKELFMLKQDFISQLADIVVIYYLRKVKVSHSMLMVINRIFSKKRTLKDRVMVDYCNWALTIKGDRDELGVFHREVVKPDTQIYYGNYNIITATPTLNHSYDVIIRNCISNVSTLVTAHFENEFHIENSLAVLLKEINKTATEANRTTQIVSRAMKSKDDCHLCLRSCNRGRAIKRNRSKSQCYSYTNKLSKVKTPNQRLFDANTIVRMLINLSTLSYSEFKQIDCNDYVVDQISLLDSIPISKTYFCGIIFFPNLTNITQYDVLSYSSTVDDRYVSFINSLGNLYDITLNPHLFLGEMSKDGSDGSYVICYKDALYHLIFHISNLLQPAYSDDPAEIISLRKRILSKDVINLIWMENPLLDCNENYFFTQSVKVFVVIHPLSTTHYQISRRYNDKAKDIELHKAIDPYLSNDYVMNFQCRCSVEYFIQSLLIMLRISDYVMKDSMKKEVCLFDNIVARMDTIKRIKSGVAG